MTSAFISILTLMDAEVRAGFAMPARASAFGSENYKNVLNADALTGIAKRARVSASISVSILMNAKAMSGFFPFSRQKCLLGCPAGRPLLSHLVQFLWLTIDSCIRRLKSF